MIRPEALAASLARGVPGVCWIHGNEPLLVLECADAARAAARKAGFGERALITTDARFDPAELAAEAGSMSLFGDRKLIEVRIPGKPRRDVVDTIASLLERGIPDDLRLLVTSERPEGALLASAPFKRIDSAGVVVQVFPVAVGELAAWITRRLAAQQQRAGPELLALIAQRVEGNLLAALQEIRKLGLLFPAGELPFDAAADAVLEVSRYEAADLVDSVLAGRAARVRRSLAGLAAAGESEVPVGWHLADCTRTLLRVREALDAGRQPSSALASVRGPRNRQDAFAAAARRLSAAALRQCLADCARADALAKGFEPGDAWQALERVALRLAGAAPLAEPS